MSEKYLMLVKRYGCNALPEKPLKWFRSYQAPLNPNLKGWGE
jgi:hypothetical protein